MPGIPLGGILEIAEGRLPTGGLRLLEQQTQVIIYTHPDCEFSDAAKQEMDKAGTPYKEIDISLVAGAAEELERLTGGDRITPVIVEGDKVTIGFYGVG